MENHQQCSSFFCILFFFHLISYTFFPPSAFLFLCSSVWALFRAPGETSHLLEINHPTSLIFTSNSPFIIPLQSKSVFICRTLSSSLCTAFHTHTSHPLLFPFQIVIPLRASSYSLFQSSFSWLFFPSSALNNLCEVPTILFSNPSSCLPLLRIFFKCLSLLFLPILETSTCNLFIQFFTASGVETFISTDLRSSRHKKTIQNHSRPALWSPDILLSALLDSHNLTLLNWWSHHFPSHCFLSVLLALLVSLPRLQTSPLLSHATPWVSHSWTQPFLWGSPSSISVLSPSQTSWGPTLGNPTFSSLLCSHQTEEAGCWFYF